MSPRLVRALFYGAIAIAAIALFVWWRSDERRLWSRLSGLETAIAKSGEEDTFTAIGKTKEIVGFFAPGFLVLAQPYEGSINDPQELAGAVHRYRSDYASIRVGDSDRSLDLHGDRGTAEMRFILVLDADRVGGPGRQRMKMRFSWVREDGEWRIHEAEVLEVLERGLF